MNRNWDVAPVRLLSLISLVFLAGGLVLVGLLVDARVDLALISMTERWVWAAVLATVLVGFFALVVWYEHRVVMQLRLSADGNFLQLTTPTLFGKRNNVVPCNEVTDLHVHGGDNAAEEAWSPPWLKLNVRGRGSFVVPLTGVAIEKERMLDFLQRCARQPEPIFAAFEHSTAAEGAAGQKTS